MVLSYAVEDECPEEPPYCLCETSEDSHFQRRGRRKRIIAQVVTHFFFCTSCRTHITMLPSSCVPYKHHPADEVNQHLDQAVQSGRSPHDISKHDSPTMHESTIRRWVKEWKVNSAVLASIASEKFSRVFQGDFRVVYQTLFQRSRFRDVQPDLCLAYPPMGIFRPLIKLS